MAGEEQFLINIATKLAGLDHEAGASRVWDDLLPIFGRYVAGDGAHYAAGLWLVDDDEASRFRLWLAINDVEQKQTQTPESIVVAVVEGLDCDAAFDRGTHLWVAPQLIARFDQSKAAAVLALPLCYKIDAKSPLKTMGMVTIMSPRNRADLTGQEAVLEAAANMAGSWLHLNRKARITKALEVLQTERQKVTNAVELAATLGKILQDHANTNQHWAIFVPNGVTIEPLAAWTHSSRVRSMTVPLDNQSLMNQFHFGAALSGVENDQTLIHFDGDGRVREGHGIDPDWTLQAVAGLRPNGRPASALLMRVRDRVSQNGDTPPVVASWMLVCGPMRGFSGGSFSQTNLRVIEHVRDYFRNSYALLLQRQRMQLINTESVRVLGEVKDMMDDAADLSHLGSFAKLSCDTIPSAVGVAVMAIQDGDLRITYYRSDGDSRARPDWLVDLPPLDSDVKTSNGTLIRRTVRPSSATARQIDIVLLCSSPLLSVVEQTILERIISEIQASLTIHLDERKWEMQLAEVRHNLRSIVQSVLAKAASVSAAFEAVRPSTVPDAEFIERLRTRAAFRKTIRQLDYNSNELLALTENIRTISARGSRIDLQISAIDIIEMIDECRSLFVDEIERREVFFNFNNNSGSNELFVDGDRGWIHIMLFNLFENAIKYSRREGRIDSRLWIEGSFWRLQVSNEGKWIPPDMISEGRIFKPYVRVPPETGEQAMPGTGIGLSSIKTIVDLHNRKGPPPPRAGVLQVSSEKIEARSTLSLTHARTSFTISIPRSLKGLQQRESQ